MRKSAAILLALGLCVSALAGSAQAAGGHNGGGHFGGHFNGGGGHFGGSHFGGHGGHFGHHGGYDRGYGYGALGFGLGLGLGALYYDNAYNDDYAGYDGYGPVAHDYDGNFPDDSMPPQDSVEQGAPPDVPGYWYRCDDPAGYYPYVGICPHPWQAVPAVPPPPSDAH